MSTFTLQLWVPIESLGSIRLLKKRAKNLSSNAEFQKYILENSGGYNKPFINLVFKIYFYFTSINIKKKLLKHILFTFIVYKKRIHSPFT